jgi:transcriptional regulator with XRE-family HTH domain
MFKNFTVADILDVYGKGLPKNPADRIRYARKARGLTQAELAEKVGVGKGLICHWEGEHSEPNLFHATLVADALNVSLDWLAGRID